MAGDLGLTENELVQALYDALSYPAPTEALTVLELMEATGYGKKRIWRGLRQLKRRGLLEVFTVMREDIAGRPNPCPAYRLRAE